MITATYLVLGLAAAAFTYRLLRGPAVADRLIGLDGVVLCGLAAIAVQAMASGSGAFLPVLVVLTAVGFVGTAAAARFIEPPGDQPADDDPASADDDAASAADDPASAEVDALTGGADAASDDDGPGGGS